MRLILTLFAGAVLALQVTSLQREAQRERRLGVAVAAAQSAAAAARDAAAAARAASTGVDSTLVEVRRQSYRVEQLSFRVLVMEDAYAELAEPGPSR